VSWILQRGGQVGLVPQVNNMRTEEEVKRQLGLVKGLLETTKEDSVILVGKLEEVIIVLRWVLGEDV